MYSFFHFCFRDMYKVSLAVVEGSVCQQLEPSIISNRIFCIDTNTEMSRGVQRSRPDIKRRKLNDQKGHIRIKSNLSVKSSESVVITAVRTVPEMFVDAKKSFSVIISWELKHSDNSCEEIQNSRSITNIHNKYIGRVHLTVQDVVSSRLEITFTPASGKLPFDMQLISML